MLQSTHRSREQILVYAKEGVGKSTCYLNIAKFSQLTKSPARFFIGYSDTALPRQLEEGYPSLTNVYPTHLTEFPDFPKWIKDCIKVAQPDDWIVCDLISSAWSWVQDYFTDEIFGSDIGNYFLGARKEMEVFNANLQRGDKEQKTLAALDGWKDWGVINKLYNDFYQRFIARTNCHIFATAFQDVLGDDKIESKENKNLYELIGFKPAGQKFVGGGFQTVLYMQGQGNQPRYIRTVKDRERAILDNVVMKDFTLTYLKGIAGWKM